MADPGVTPVTTKVELEEIRLKERRKKKRKKLKGELAGDWKQRPRETSPFQLFRTNAPGFCSKPPPRPRPSY